MGILKRMSFVNEGSEYVVIPNYSLDFEGNILKFNTLIGKNISFSFQGKISCIICGATTKKSFGQGYCYSCFVSVPQTEECVLRPELCRAHEGVARDMEFAKENCLVDQYVYLSLSGGMKVGVTRYHQVPTRWVDQGANKAAIIAITRNRYSAGLIEVLLKKIFADKTNWRKMLTGNDPESSLVEPRKRAIEYIEREGLTFSKPEDAEYRIEYPVLSFPKKVLSIDLEKKNTLSGILIGIKGQYLLFESGEVLNIRKHSGYHVAFNIL